MLYWLHAYTTYKNHTQYGIQVVQLEFKENTNFPKRARDREKEGSSNVMATLIRFFCVTREGIVYHFGSARRLQPKAPLPIRLTEVLTELRLKWNTSAWSDFFFPLHFRSFLDCELLRCSLQKIRGFADINERVSFISSTFTFLCTRAPLHEEHL